MKWYLCIENDIIISMRGPAFTKTALREKFSFAEFHRMKIVDFRKWINPNEKLTELNNWPVTTTHATQKLVDIEKKIEGLTCESLDGDINMSKQEIINFHCGHREIWASMCSRL